MARQHRTACLDFSLGRISCLELTGGTVSGWLVQPLDPTAVRQGDPADPEQLGAHLRQLMSAAGMRADRARIAISDEAVVTQVTELPRMPDRHLGQAMRFTAERQLPFPFDRACWSWDVVGRSPTGAHVLLAGAWRDVVERLVEVARCAGLRCEVVEPRSLAVGRALSVEQAVVLDAGLGRAELTVVAEAHAPYVDRAVLGPDRAGWPPVLDRLLRRAAAHQAALAVSAGRSSVVLAGELEPLVPYLAAPARRAVDVLNGHQPARPAGLPAGVLLANLGLAMRRER